MQTYITQTTAHDYNGQAFYINALNNGSYTVDADGYEFGFAYASREEAIQNAEYKIWNNTQCGGMDWIS